MEIQVEKSYGAWYHFMQFGKKKPWKHFMLLIDNYVCSKEQEYEIYTPTSIYLLTL